MKCKIIKKWGVDFYKLLVKDFELFSVACEKREIASGGYCKCCERYACGVGGVNHT